MKVKFANGVIKNCNAPTEQKLFRTVGGVSVGTVWVLALKLIGEITSSQLDELLVPENFSSLEFYKEVENEEGEIVDCELFTLSGYSNITLSSIRHAEDASASYAEIQITKGV